MHILGYTKTTLLDYPGHVAATIFTGGCNFRCPYCHNGEFVVGSNNMEAISAEYVFSHLLKRRNVLNGVCISGGEPTLQPDLYEFILKIKDLGYKVKLDTNGSSPEILRTLIDDNLIDYVAMDIKNSIDKYTVTAACDERIIPKVTESVKILLENKIDYEFRTTIVKELHVKEDIKKICELIEGSKRYYVQGYVESENVIEKGFHAYTKDEILELIDFDRKINISIRGIE